MAQHTFRTLPLEIREMIYRLVFPREVYLDYCSCSPERKKRGTYDFVGHDTSQTTQGGTEKAQRKNPLLPLLLTNRQMSAEATTLPHPLISICVCDMSRLRELFSLMTPAEDRALSRIRMKGGKDSPMRNPRFEQFVTGQIQISFLGILIGAFNDHRATVRNGWVETPSGRTAEEARAWEVELARP